MNNGLKIGLGILVAVLLVITAVSVTLAVAGNGTVRQASNIGYQNASGAGVQYVSAPWYGCPAWGSAYNNQQGGTGTAYYRGCWGW